VVRGKAPILSKLLNFTNQSKLLNFTNQATRILASC